MVLTHKRKIKSHYFQREIKTTYYFKLTPTYSFQEEGQRNIHGFTVEREGERGWGNMKKKKDRKANINRLKNLFYNYMS